MDVLQGKVISTSIDDDGCVRLQIVDEEGVEHEFRAARMRDALAKAERRFLAATGLVEGRSQAERAEVVAEHATEGAAAEQDPNFRLVQAQVAQVHATLALVEAVERLTGHIERVWRRT